VRHAMEAGWLDDNGHITEHAPSGIVVQDNLEATRWREYALELRAELEQVKKNLFFATKIIDKVEEIL